MMHISNVRTYNSPYFAGELAKRDQGGEITRELGKYQKDAEWMGQLAQQGHVDAARTGLTNLLINRATDNGKPISDAEARQMANDLLDTILSDE
jgi:hypothetical protein